MYKCHTSRGSCPFCATGRGLAVKPTKIHIGKRYPHFLFVRKRGESLRRTRGSGRSRENALYLTYFCLIMPRKWCRFIKNIKRPQGPKFFVFLRVSAAHRKGCPFPLNFVFSRTVPCPRSHSTAARLLPYRRIINRRSLSTSRPSLFLPLLR